MILVFVWPRNCEICDIGTPLCHPDRRCVTQNVRRNVSKLRHSFDPPAEGDIDSLDRAALKLDDMVGQRDRLRLTEPLIQIVGHRNDGASLVCRSSVTAQVYQLAIEVHLRPLHLADRRLAGAGGDGDLHKERQVVCRRHRSAKQLELLALRYLSRGGGAGGISKTKLR